MTNQTTSSYRNDVPMSYSSTNSKGYLQSKLTRLTNGINGMDTV